MNYLGAPHPYHAISRTYSECACTALMATSETGKAKFHSARIEFTPGWRENLSNAAWKEKESGVRWQKEHL